MSTNTFIDLLLITARTLHWKEEKAMVEVLFDVGMEYGVIVSPVLVSSQEWNMTYSLSFLFTK
jgi:hypothetical protein